MSEDHVSGVFYPSSKDIRKATQNIAKTVGICGIFTAGVYVFGNYMIKHSEISEFNQRVFSVSSYLMMAFTGLVAVGGGFLAWAGPKRGVTLDTEKKEIGDVNFGKTISMPYEKIVSVAAEPSSDKTGTGTVKLEVILKDKPEHNALKNSEGFFEFNIPYQEAYLDLAKKIQMHIS